MAEVSLIQKKKEERFCRSPPNTPNPPLLSKIFAYACLYYEDGWKKLQKQNDTFLSHTAMSILFYFIILLSKNILINLGM